MSEKAQNINEYFESIDVTERLPKLAGRYRKTSSATFEYNCLAWALGANWAFFSPESKHLGYYWPPGVPREWNLRNIRKIFNLHGYHDETNSRILETGFEKVAFYVDNEGEPSHFARQLESGKWTSKLGDLIDIEHDDLECLECEDYGEVSLILKRPRSTKSDAR